MVPSHFWAKRFLHSEVYTLLRIRSRRVAVAISVAVIGMASICEMLKIDVVSDGSDGASGKGSRESPSALAWSCVGLNLISYVYADSKTHLCRRAAAKAGMPFLGPRIANNSLWSVISWNLRPYRH